MLQFVELTNNVLFKKGVKQNEPDIILCVTGGLTSLLLYYADLQLIHYPNHFIYLPPCQILSSGNSLIFQDRCTRVPIFVLIQLLELVYELLEFVYESLEFV